MKKIVITKEQLNKINEDASIGVQASSNDAGSFVNAATSPETSRKMQDMSGAGVDASIKVSGPKKDDSKPTINVDVPQGQSIQSIVSSNPDIAKGINSNCSVEFSGKGVGMSESVLFKKRDVERKRINEMKKNSIIKKKIDFIK